MKTFFLIGILGGLAAAGLASAQSIEARLSIKVIVHPTTGARPPGITNELFTTAVSNANLWMGTYWRGYRYQITEILNIGGPTQGGTNGPSAWYNIWPTGAQAALFQENTRTNSLYLRRTNQVNFYVSMSPVSNTGGFCPIPPGGASELSCYGGVNSGPWWVVHEVGHFFGLRHTFGGCQCAGGCTYPDTGDDGIADTLPEGDCWTIDQIAQKHYSMTASALTNSAVTNALHRQWLENVNNTYYNVMSYHDWQNKDVTMNRKTEGQLDHFANIANSDRRPFVSGFTRFVSPSGVNSGGGTSSSAPLRTLGYSVGVAVPGQDILLLRPGNYNEQLTINKPVTLRATRNGWATIGR